MSSENLTVKLPSSRTLGYAQYGDPKGKPLFFFHGWPSSRLAAAYTDETAKKLGVRVIAIDRPGYGLSSFQENRTLLDWPADVVAVADFLRIKKFAVEGVSGGGPYAAVCAYKIPQRLTNAGIHVGLAPPYIEGLLEGMSWTAKIGWSYYGSIPALRNFAGILHWANAHYGPSFGLHRFLFGAKADKKAYADPHVRQAIQRNYKEAFRNGYKGAAWDLKLYTQDWGFDLRDIKANVFLFYGADDTNVPLAMGKYYASQIPNSKLLIYPNEGHLLRLNHMEEILKTLIE